METTTLNFDFLPRKSVVTEIADDVDCYQLFSYLKTQYDSCYFFESLALPRHQDRFFSLGFDPAVTFSVQGNVTSLSGNADIIEKLTGYNTSTLELEVDNPYQFFRNAVNFDRIAAQHAGGLVGYFCHEAVNYIEPQLQLQEHDQFSNFKLGLFLDSFVFDSTTATLSYHCLGEDRRALCEDLVAQSQSFKIPTTLKSAVFKGHTETKAEFIRAVEHTKEKIRAGYSFQSEVGFKSHYQLKGDKSAIYNKLRQINPSPYMYYLKFGDEELLGASPEILISSKNGRILTTPTAGTALRGKDAASDIRNARALLKDPKEIAEHNMLIDLHRNDVARVSKPGTVKIDDLMYIIKFSHVQHIVSNVVGELRADRNAFDVLACILPGGVATGAPKIETIHIINTNEKSPRGPYGGAVGRFSFNGDCDFCLPIRSIFCKGDYCFAQTSAGVVYDSDPEKEYKEVRCKLAAMEQVLNALGAGVDA